MAPLHQILQSSKVLGQYITRGWETGAGLAFEDIWSIVLQVSCEMLWVGTYLQDSTNLIHLKALDSVAVFSWRDRTSDTLVMTSCKWFWHINYQFERSTSSQRHRKSHLGSVLISMSERRELDGPIEVGCLKIFKWFECHIDLFATCAGWI